MRLEELFEDLNYALYEARKNPTLNPRLPAYQQLQQYKDDPNIFISFTEINKLGINPLSRYKETPLGIYTYPLKETWKEYNVDGNKSFKDYPFAETEPHIQVVKWNGRGIFIDVSEYSNTMLHTDIEKIKRMYKNDDKLQIALQKLNSDDSPISQLWNICISLIGDNIHTLTHTIRKDDKRLKKEITISEGSRNWNALLRKLGYAGFSDKHGHGFIHPSEPIQAFFTSIDVITHLGTVLNKDYTEKSVQKPTFLEGGYATGIIVDGKQIILSPKSSEKILKYNDAINYVNNLKIGGKSDWVLPSVEDLLELSSNHNLFTNYGIVAKDYYTREHDRKFIYAVHMGLRSKRTTSMDNLNDTEFYVRAIRYSHNVPKTPKLSLSLL